MKKKKTDRDQFVGVKVSKETKLAIIKEAEKRDTSMSQVVIEVLTEAFPSGQDTTAPEDRG